jgi:AraC family transcriptional regulator, alkane utilization regulator
MDLLSDFEAPDPVSEVLRAVRVRSTVYCRSVIGAPWGFGVTAHGNPAFHVVTTGTCWLEVDGGPDQIPLTAGDLVVLPTGQRHWLRDNPATPAIELEELLAASPLDEHRRLHCGGGGSRTGLLCGGFALEGGAAHPVLRILPATVLIRGVNGHPVPWLAATLALLSAETASAAPGAEEIVGRLADALLAQALRVALAELQASDGAGVLALRDPQLATAIERIHHSPDHAWTVGELAGEVALSGLPSRRASANSSASRPSATSRAPVSPTPPPCCTRPTPLWRRSPSRSAMAASSPSPRPSSVPSALPPAPTADSRTVSPGSVAAPIPPCSPRTSLGRFA